jgi:hypothetical protein
VFLLSRERRCRSVSIRMAARHAEPMEQGIGNSKSLSGVGLLHRSRRWAWERPDSGGLGSVLADGVIWISGLLRRRIAEKFL